MMCVAAPPPPLVWTLPEKGGLITWHHLRHSPPLGERQITRGVHYHLTSSWLTLDALGDKGG